jgi:hypothetical protein
MEYGLLLELEPRRGSICFRQESVVAIDLKHAVLVDRETVKRLLLSNTLDGRVIGLCQECHRHQNWIHFQRLIDAQVRSENEVKT